MKKVIDFKIYNEFDECLLKGWQKLFALLEGNYNLSPEWCLIWFKHFGNKHKKIFIYTAWEEDELKLVAPFYLEGNVLHLIGSKPDFYDEFGILSMSAEYTENLAVDILDKKFKVDFRLVNTECDFLKFFLKEIENSKDFSKKIYYSTLKLQADSDFNFQKSFLKKIRNKITSSNNKFNQKLIFEFETEKKSGFLEEMLIFHKKRWSLFKSKKKELFLKDIYYKTDLFLLARLSYENTGRTVSYQLVYKYFGNISGMLSAFNPCYKVISPSLLSHYYLFKEAFEKGYSVINFGAGAQRYKYDFANSESVILCIKTNSSILRKYDFIYNLLKNLKDEFNSLLIWQN